MKADLDLQFDARGPRPADHVRPVDPPLPVERVTWTPTWTPTGTMDNWLWHDKGWLGRVIEPDGRIAWVPEPELRPDQTPAPAPGHDDQTGAA